MTAKEYLSQVKCLDAKIKVKISELNNLKSQFYLIPAAKIDDEKVKSSTQNKGFPIHTKRVNNNSFKVVRINEFWEWAERNRSMVDFSKLEPNILGKEPKWVKLQRELDADDFKTTPWEQWEDDKLIFLLGKFKYSYYDLSFELNRSCGAIQRRVIDLGLKERPLKAENHIKWQTMEIEDMKHLISLGYNYKGLAKAIGKSDKAIRGKVGVMYGTENLDKVRIIMKTPLS